VSGLGRAALWRSPTPYRQGGLVTALHAEARPEQPRN